MAKLMLSLDTLKDLDPRIKAAFDIELKKIVDDLNDRPSEKKARVLRLQLNAVPVVEPNSGSCELAQIQFDVEAKLPKKRTRTYQAEVNHRGGVVINPASPDAVRQGTLDEVDPVTGEVRDAD